MKLVLGMVSLLVVLAVVGVLARKQLGAASGAVNAPATPSTAEAVVVPSGTPQQQIRQVQQAVQGSMQERPMPDDIK